MKQTEYLFYDTHATYLSAKKIISEIKPLLPPMNSIVDIGCGMAAFAKVFQEFGVNAIQLVDHPSLDISNCLVKENFKFIPCDLDKELPKQIKADLAVCTEVLEHIDFKRALEVLDFITSCADIIIFSAGIPGQGGIGHINEQRHTFWIDEFKKRGFDYSDNFRLKIIKDEEILYWLRQNIFIFHKNQKGDSPLLNSKLLGRNFEIVNEYILNRQFGFVELVRMLPKALYASILKRIRFK